MGESLEFILVYFFEDYKLLYKYLLVTLIIIYFYIYISISKKKLLNFSNLSIFIILHNF